MHMRTLFRLLVAVLFTGAFYAFVTVRDRSADAIPSEGALLLDLDPETVDLLDVETHDWQVKCRKVRGRWRLLAPLQSAADVDVVERIVSELSLLPREEVATPAQMKLRKLTLDSYGLENPAIKVTVGSGSTPPVTVLLGAQAPFPASFFVKRTDEPVVVTTRTNLLAALPGEVGTFRDRRLLEGNASAVTQLSVERRSSSFVQMGREQGEWRLLQPVSDRADSSRVQALLRDLLAVEVREVVSTAQADPAAYGLAPESVEATVTLWMDGDTAGTKLELGLVRGPGGDRVCARIGGTGPILAVDTNILALLSFKVQDFRDRVRLRFNPDLVRLFTLETGERRMAGRKTDDQGWILTEPAQVKADAERVRAFLTGLPGLTAVGFEDSAPEMTNAAPLFQVRLWASDAPPQNGSTPPDAYLRLLGAVREDLYRADSGNGLVFLLSGPQVRQALGPEPFWDPLRFRDLRVLNLESNMIKRLTLTRGEVEQRVERDEKGHWISHEGRTVNPAAVESLLNAAGTLRAMRLESPEADTSGFGFETPFARIDFGLAGADGIQKTLVIGLADAGGNRYARVQGQDLAFVLSAETAAALMRDLLQ